VCVGTGGGGEFIPDLHVVLVTVRAIDVRESVAGDDVMGNAVYWFLAVYPRLKPYARQLGMMETIQG